MSERVKINVPGVRISETGLALLRLVAGADDDGGQDGLTMGVANIADRLGKSPNGVRYIVHRLLDQGLLEVRPQHRENRGCMENLYVLTPAGREVLAACDPLAERVPGD